MKKQQKRVLPGVPLKRIVSRTEQITSDHAFNKYQTLWSELHAAIDSALKSETQETREYVIDRLNDEFRFLEHMFIANVGDGLRG